MGVDLKNINSRFQEKGLEGNSNQVKFPFGQVLSSELACRKRKVAVNPTSHYTLA